VSSRGRQYDRLALMYLGDTEVFRTSTAEPTSTGIVWTYVKEMSQYNALWKDKQKLIFDLGNVVNSIYTGDYNTTLTAHFSYEGNVKSADYILPISSKGSASNSSSSFTLPTDNTTVKYTIPAAASRAVVAISACGQSEEEFWWSNVFSQDEEDFSNTVGELYGYSPFREIQLYIDGMLAGFVWPFPIIFTGGVAPGFWHPIVGIDAFDLRMPEIDISPFLPLLQDGKEHSFEIRVTGLAVSANGTVTLADTVGSYWVVTGNIFLYTEEKKDSEDLAALGNSIPRIEAPAPKFTATRNLGESETGNNTLSYSIVAERTFSASSDKYSWTQKLSFSNYGYVNQQGYSQVNKQLTSGVSTLTGLEDKSESYETTFKYPLLVNATYGITADSLTIDSWMKRGLDIEASGGLGISTYTFASGPSTLHTTQSGQARYKSVTSGTTSWGKTADEFHSTANGESYSRSVRAVGGDVVFDTKPGAWSVSSSRGTDTIGRQSVREMLGRGPGKQRN
jgi:Peptide N-acetyl-beta-D-glucosaminyl asparaginase amidase A.